MIKMVKRLRIGVDLDDILSKTIPTLFDLCNQRYNTQLKIEEIVREINKFVS